MENLNIASQREENTEGELQLTVEEKRRAQLGGYVAALRAGRELTPAAGDEALVARLVAVHGSRVVQPAKIERTATRTAFTSLAAAPDPKVLAFRQAYGPKAVTGDDPLIDELVAALVKAARAPSTTGGKRGRKASGLRDLSPEAARLVVLGWSIEAVREACAAQTRMAQSNSYGTAPDLVRLLNGDLELRRVWIVEIGEAGSRVAARPVVSARDSLVEQLIGIGVNVDLARIAPRFLADVERARIGKLTSSYGEGGGAAQAAEPERLVMAMDQLRRATAKLNWQQRAALWGFLVFGLPLQDVGHVVAAGKFAGDPKSLIAAAVMILEGAFQALEVFYRNAGDSH